jgi:hypothetical protein
MNNKQKIRASFSVAPKTAKVAATALYEVLTKVEKALNFWMENVNREREPVNGSVLQQKALSLYEGFLNKMERKRELSLLKQA